MALTYGQVIDLTEQILQDTSNATWTAAELGQYLRDSILVISRYVPRELKYTLTLSASKNYTLLDEHKRNMLWLTGPDRGIPAIEYDIDEDPIQLHNISEYGGIVTISVSNTPAAGDEAYLYVAKSHVLNELGTDDTAGAANANTDAGKTSLVVKALGTGTINEDSNLTIAGDDTAYLVTSTATISGNIATVNLYPALAAAVTADDVVTLSAPTSSLTPTLERLLAEYTAGLALINKSHLTIDKVNNGGGNVTQSYYQLGQIRIASVLTQLSRMVKTIGYEEYPE